VVLKKNRWKHLVLIANKSEQQYKLCFVFVDTIEQIDGTIYPYVDLQPRLMSKIVRGKTYPTFLHICGYEAMKKWRLKPPIGYHQAPEHAAPLGVGEL